MKIAFTPYFPGNPYQPILIEELQKQGCECLTAVKPSLDAAKKFGKVDIVHLHWLPRFRKGISGYIQLWRYLRVLRAMTSSGARLVWTVHNLIPHGSHSQKVDTLASKRVAKLASKLIAHSHIAKDVIHKTYEVPLEKIDVVPHGNYVGLYPNTITKTEARRRLGIPENTTCFAFVGMIRPYKGVMQLIEDFSSNSNIDATLLIAGEPTGGISKEELQDKVQNDKRIILNPNRVEDEDMQLYLNACDATLFPYQRSLTSGAIILAMSFAKACIAYRNEGSLAVLDESGAILVDDNKPNGFSDAISYCVHNKHFLSAAGARNYELCREWNWDRIAAKTRDIYEASRDLP